MCFLNGIVMVIIHSTVGSFKLAELQNLIVYLNNPPTI